MLKAKPKTPKPAPETGEPDGPEAHHVQHFFITSDPAFCAVAWQPSVMSSDVGPVFMATHPPGGYRNVQVNAVSEHKATLWLDIDYRDLEGVEGSVVAYPQTFDAMSKAYWQLDPKHPVFGRLYEKRLARFKAFTEAQPDAARAVRKLGHDPLKGGIAIAYSVFDGINRGFQREADEAIKALGLPTLDEALARAAEEGTP